MIDATSDTPATPDDQPATRSTIAQVCGAAIVPFVAEPPAPPCAESPSTPEA